MVDVGYWIETFLSTPAELAVLALTVLVFGVASRLYSDARDAAAVGVAIGALSVTLVFAGPRLAGEWHYWFFGAVLFASGILLVDRKRR